MGKGDRRGKAKMPELAPIISAKARPRDGRGVFVKPSEDARMVALTARCHQIGTTPDKEGRAKVANPMMGSEIGKCISALHEPREASRLWGCWQAWGIVETRYSVRILGKAPGPANSALPVMPERFEVDASLASDIRTPDEKDNDATRAWMHWRGLLGQLPTGDATRLHEARKEVPDTLWREQTATASGRMAVAALERLADVADR